MSSPASPERARRLQQAYVEACRLELRALKPGNVHVASEGHGMTVAQFEASAVASAPPLAVPGKPVGERIRDAVAATHAAVGCNTNLGIVLLAAPLLAAAERAGAGGLRPALAATLADLTVADAAAAYEAIRLAGPAGLGRADAQDVQQAPTVDLRQAMALAADRDRIARQYADDYDDVLAIGVRRLELARRDGASAEWAATRAYMDFLAAFADSHLLRKHGAEIAEAVRGEAAALNARLDGAPRDARMIADLVAFDARLKSRGLNPGSSADLTVASLLALACEDMLAGDSRAQGSHGLPKRDLHKTKGSDVMAKVTKVMVGEALVGDGNEVAHIDLIIGPRGSAAETAFCHTLTSQREGVNGLLAVIGPNLMCKPSTVMFNKVTIKNAKQAVQMFGPAQRAVATAVADCVKDGTIPAAEADDLFICVGVFIHWEASNDQKIQDFNYEATKLSIKRAVAGEPNARQMLEQRDKVAHPFAAHK